MDPSPTTAIRNVIWPDVNGANMVIDGTSHPATATDAGTKGTVTWDGSGNLYFCWKSGAAGSAGWIKVTGIYPL
jgi:hypothetical protein